MCWSAERLRAGLSSSEGSGASGYASDVSRDLPEVLILRTIVVTLTFAKIHYPMTAAAGKLGIWPCCLSRPRMQRLPPVLSQPQHGSTAVAGSSPLAQSSAFPLLCSCLDEGLQGLPELPAVSALLCQVVYCIRGSVHLRLQPRASTEACTV